MLIIGLYLNKETRTGANRRYLELMEGLAMRGNTVIVVMNTLFDYSPTSFTRIEIPILYTRKGLPPASWLFARKSSQIATAILDICAQKKNTKPGWILIHGETHLSLAIKLKRSIGAKLFFAFRCNDVLRGKILRKSGLLSKKDIFESFVFEKLSIHRERLVKKFADIVCFQNQIDRKDWTERTHAKIEQSVIIHGNIGLPRCTEKWKNTNHVERLNTLIYIGAISASKGLFQVFSVLQMLRSRGYNNIKLIVLGNIEGSEAVLNLTDKLGISSCITWPGYTLPFPYLAQASLMIFPSLYDAFPDTVLEALHVGCPVIASNRGGIPEILGLSELLFDPDDIRGMSDFIERCIQNPSEYNRVRNLCKIRADLFRFDWTESWEKAMLDVIKS